MVGPLVLHECAVYAILPKGDDLCLMTSAGAVSQQVGSGDGGRSCIDERMQVDNLSLCQRIVDYETHSACYIVDEGKWRDRSGSYAEVLHHPVLRGKRKATAPQSLRQYFQVDIPVFMATDQPHFPLFVSQE